MPANIQYELNTIEPDGIGTLTFNGGVGQTKKYLCPCRSTIDWIKVNQFNLKVVATSTKILGQPLAAGTVRLGIYRCVYPPKPASATATTVAELVAGSTATINCPGNGIVTTINVPNMASEVLALGGSFWIALQLEDNTVSGTNHMVFTTNGFTASDTNLEHAWFTFTSGTAALPTTIAINTLTNTADMPWTSAFWV